MSKGMSKDEIVEYSVIMKKVYQRKEVVEYSAIMLSKTTLMM